MLRAHVCGRSGGELLIEDVVLVTHGGALQPVMLGDADHPPIGHIRHLVTLGVGGLGLVMMLGRTEVRRRHLEDRERMLGLIADWRTRGSHSLSLDRQCEATAGPGTQYWHDAD